MPRRQRPEVGKLPRAQFGNETPRAGMQPPQNRAPVQLDPFPLLDRLILERQMLIDRVDVWEADETGRVKKEAEEMRSTYTSEFRELQALKRVFQGANLMGHDKEAMYHLLAEQIGFADGSDHDSGGEQGQDRDS